MPRTLPKRAGARLARRRARYKARKRGRSYIRDLRFKGVEATGKDLEKLGLTPGPQYDRILKELTALRLDGVLGSKKEELRYVIDRYVKK